jgi:hypothetical protein
VVVLVVLRLVLLIARSAANGHPRCHGSCSSDLLPAWRAIMPMVLLLPLPAAALSPAWRSPVLPHAPDRPMSLPPQASAPSMQRVMSPRPESPCAVQRSSTSCNSPRMRKALLRTGSMHRRMKDLVDRAASRTNKQQRLDLPPPMAAAATYTEYEPRFGISNVSSSQVDIQLPGAAARRTSSGTVNITVSGSLGGLGGIMSTGSSNALRGSSSALNSSNGNSRRQQQEVVGERGPGSIVGDLNFEGVLKPSEVTVIAKTSVHVLAIKKADVQGVPAKMLIKAVIERHRTESIVTETFEKLAAWEDDMAEMDEWRSQMDCTPVSRQGSQMEGGPPALARLQQAEEAAGVSGSWAR